MDYIPGLTLLTRTNFYINPFFMYSGLLCPSFTIRDLTIVAVSNDVLSLLPLVKIPLHRYCITNFFILDFDLGLSIQ